MGSVHAWRPAGAAKSSTPGAPKAASASLPEVGSRRATPVVSLKVQQEGFPRSVRLTHARDFDRVFRTATARHRHGALRLSAVANRMHTARLGLVVGKRALSRAPERNRAKRVLREAFRRRRHELPAMDIVIQVAGDAANDAYRASLEALFAKLPSNAQ